MIKRKIFSILEKHLSSDQMTILVGPRQVGKTYLMNILKKTLDQKGLKTIWLNLDNEEDKQKLVSQASLIKHIELKTEKEKAYVFIDEIQQKENAGLFLKGIFDMKLPHKFIVTGSGSLELKAKIPESMAGRKQLFLINPIDFEEFVNYKTDYQYKDKLIKFFDSEQNQTERLFSEYLVFGGYPRIILAKSINSKQREMQEIYRSYIDRDIHNLLHLEKTDEFADLLKIIASQIGGLVNISELSSTIGIDQKTIKHYLWYLEKTFILKKVTPYYRNTRKEITKAPIYYFSDLGFRNWILGLFGLDEIPIPLSGHLFENAIFNLLDNPSAFVPTQIHFWRTRDQAEVDFVLEQGLKVIPIEAKYKKLSKILIPRSFRNFLTKYKPNIGYIIHIGNHQSQQKINNTTVKLLPYYKLILQNPF